jgi:hypothetical protein
VGAGREEGAEAKKDEADRRLGPAHLFASVALRRPDDPTTGQLDLAGPRAMSPSHSRHVLAPPPPVGLTHPAPLKLQSDRRISASNGELRGLTLQEFAPVLGGWRATPCASLILFHPCATIARGSSSRIMIIMHCH